MRDFPGSPVVEISPSQAMRAGSILGHGGLRSHMPLSQKKRRKTWNRSNSVTISINTLKVVHIKKIKNRVPVSKMIDIYLHTT